MRNEYVVSGHHSRAQRDDSVLGDDDNALFDSLFSPTIYAFPLLYLCCFSTLVANTRLSPIDSTSFVMESVCQWRFGPYSVAQESGYSFAVKIERNWR